MDKIEAEMKKIIKKGAKLEKFELPREEAIKFMEDKGEPYKVELIKDLPEDAVISFYSQGENFTDLCAGPHLMSTKSIKAFKLISSSGAYWRGNEKNKMLTRIYGTAFPKKEELNAYLEHLEDVKRRDHNKLGREMELFTTVDVIGQGLPLLMPKGAKLFRHFKDGLKMKKITTAVMCVLRHHLWQRVICTRFQVTGTITKTECL